MATDRARRTATTGGGTDLVVCLACGLGFVALAALVCSGATAQADGRPGAGRIRQDGVAHARVPARDQRSLSPMVLVAVAGMATLALFRGRVLNLIAWRSLRAQRGAQGGVLPSASGGIHAGGGVGLLVSVRPRHGLHNGRRTGMACPAPATGRPRDVIQVARTASVALVCASRVYLGAHYPSDVVAGVLVALARVALAHRLAGRAAAWRCPSVAPGARTHDNGSQSANAVARGRSHGSGSVGRLHGRDRGRDHHQAPPHGLKHPHDRGARRHRGPGERRLPGCHLQHHARGQRRRPG